MIPPDHPGSILYHLKFHKPVTGQELFFSVSYSKPALIGTAEGPKILGVGLNVNRLFILFFRSLFLYLHVQLIIFKYSFAYLCISLIFSIDLMVRRSLL